jgi:hypothetical protein
MNGGLQMVIVTGQKLKKECFKIKKQNLIEFDKKKIHQQLSDIPILTHLPYFTICLGILDQY